MFGIQHADTHLSRMCRQSMTKLCSYSTGFGQFFRDEGRKLVAVLRMTRKWKHLATQSHEFDAVSIIPSQHFHDIFCIRLAKGFNECLTSGDIWRLFSIWPVLGRMWWFIWIAEWMAVFYDRCNATCSRAEDWWIRKAKVSA